MSLEMIAGSVVAFIASLFFAFWGGKKSGQKDKQVKYLEAEIKLREKYAEIDNSKDVDNPLAEL